MRKNLLHIALFLLLWGFYAGFTLVWLYPQQSNFDFFPRWYGAREMLRGEDPYDLVLTRSLLEEQGFRDYVSKRFLYLASITWILLPFWLLPFSIAVSLWAGLQILLMMLLPLLVAHVLKWRLHPPWVVGLIFLSTLLNFHVVNVYVIAQFVAFILACLVVAWWQITEGHDWLAALALVGATIRPEGAIITAGILLSLLLMRRFRIVVIWGAIMGSILLVTFVQIGFWLPDFVHGVRNFGSWTYMDQPVHPPNLLGSPLLAKGLLAGVLGWSLFMLWQMRSLPDRWRVAWSLSVLIIASLLVLPQTHDWTLLYAMFPTWLLLWAGRRQRWLIVLLVVITAASYPVRYSGLTALVHAQQLWVPIILGGLLTIYWRRMALELNEAHGETRYTDSLF